MFLNFNGIIQCRFYGFEARLGVDWWILPGMDWLSGGTERYQVARARLYRYWLACKKLNILFVIDQILKK